MREPYHTPTLTELPVPESWRPLVAASLEGWRDAPSALGRALIEDLLGDMGEALWRRRDQGRTAE